MSKRAIGVAVVYWFLAVYLGNAISFLLLVSLAGLLVIYYYLSRPRHGISVADPLLMESAVSLANKIKQRKITSLELVDLHIQHIKSINPLLNAMVADRFEEARKEAQMADSLTARTPPEELPPFHGVPFSVKEAFGVTGMPNSSGLLSRRGVISKTDAVVVDRLRKAGAIPICVTNVSELCMWMESSNLLYGTTNNPYDVSRIVGGSSGGEGAMVSACTPFGVGSDIGGSLRMPAYFCGLFTHKCSGGLVNNEGQFPISRNKALRYLCSGPLCKKAEDLLPLLKIMIGDDRVEYTLEKREVDYRGLRVVSVRQGPRRVLFKRVSKEITEAQKGVEAYLASKGALVEVLEYLPEFEETLEMWSSALTDAGNDDFAYLMGNCTKRISVVKELLLWFVDNPSHTLPAIGLALLESIEKWFPRMRKQNVEKIEIVKTKLNNLLGKNAILLYPTYPEVAPHHSTPLIPPFNWVYTAIFNILEFPVTQVPLGLNKEGLPVGIQVASLPGNDSLTIAISVELETKFGGWVPPILLPLPKLKSKQSRFSPS